MNEKETKFVMCDGQTFLRVFPGFAMLSPAIARELREDPDYEVRYIEADGRILALEFGYASDDWRLVPPSPSAA